MKLKTIEHEGKVYAEVNADGRVLYDDDGKEFAFDAADTYAKIKQLTGEAQSHREAKETAAKAMSELQAKMQGVDLSKMVDAGKLDEVRAEVGKSYQQKIDELTSQLETLNKKSQESAIDAAFGASQYIKENLNMPTQVARKNFADNLSFEDGKLIVKDMEGNPIYSRKNPGSHAGFDEAMGILVDSLPYRDDILKARNHQGAGGDNNGGRARTISRKDFESMSAAEQAKAAEGMRNGTIELTE